MGLSTIDGMKGFGETGVAGLGSVGVVLTEFDGSRKRWLALEGPWTEYKYDGSKFSKLVIFVDQQRKRQSAKPDLVEWRLTNGQELIGGTNSLQHLFVTIEKQLLYETSHHVIRISSIRHIKRIFCVLICDETIRLVSNRVLIVRWCRLFLSSFPFILSNPSSFIYQSYNIVCTCRFCS